MPYAPLPARSVRKFATIVSSQKLGACATTSFLYHCSARAIERSLECGCTDRMNNYLAVQRRRFRHARNRIFPTSSAICLCCVFGATRTEGGFKGPDALPTTIAFRSSSPCVSSTCTLKPITATQAAIASAVGSKSCSRSTLARMHPELSSRRRAMWKNSIDRRCSGIVSPANASTTMTSYERWHCSRKSPPSDT